MLAYWRRCMTVVALISSIAAPSLSFSQSSASKLRDDEIGVEDSRGYVLGSSIQVNRNGELVTIRSRIVNGSKSASTIDWHSAGIREPNLEPGQPAPRTQKFDVRGWRRFLYWPVPFDYSNWAGHSATVETRMGSFTIDGAPAFQTRIGYVELAAQALRENVGEIRIETILELLVRGKRNSVKLISEAKADKQGMTYFARIENQGTESVYVQWIGLGNAKQPLGVIVGVGPKARKTVAERKYSWPVYLVNDAAFVNGESTGSLPGSAVRYLGRELRFDVRIRELAAMKLGSNAMVVAPTVAGGE